jgi:hypothetical protein
MVDNYYPALTDTKLCSIADFKPETILNKRIAPQFVESYENILFVNGNDKISCYISDDEQYFINNNSVSDETYSRFVENLSALTCDSVLYAENLTPLNIYVEYLSKDKTSMKFEFYKQNDDMYAVTSDGKTFLEVRAYNFEQWLNKLSLTI